ncbi:MAG: DsrE family protein [Bacteroidota bacterium]
MQKLWSILVGLFATVALQAQVKSKGPVIIDFGEVYPVENPSFETKTNGELKVVFDVVNSPEGQGLFNRSIETAARFLNMHAQNGFAAEALHVALVVHGGATQDLLNDAYFEQNFSTSNENVALLRALMDAGAKIIVCGQSLAARGYDAEQLIPGVQIALSAMTALIQLQETDYQLIKF